MKKSEIVRIETYGIINEHEIGITGLDNAMDVYGKQQAIGFAEYLEQYVNIGKSTYVKQGKRYKVEELYEDYLKLFEDAEK